MSDNNPVTGSSEEHQLGADSGPKRLPPEHATPRWVKIFGFCALALVLIFVAVHLAGGGFANHMP